MSRYVLSGVWADGVPVDLESFDSLEDALRERDRRWVNRGIPFFGVYDRDDGERGWLEREDEE